MALCGLKWMVAAAAAFAPAVAAAQSAAPTDSVSAAMATVIADYVRTSLDRQYPGDDIAVGQFVDGVKKAFDIPSVETVYYDGIARGIIIKDQLETMRHAGYPIDNSMFIDAFVKAVEGVSTGFTSESAHNYLDEIEHRAAQADRKAQQAFLDTQAAREGVTALPSGLLFETVTEGEGTAPTADDTVRVFYTGRLADGTVFDSTADSPAEFPVSRLIAGFTEGLQLMKPGGTYRLFIPASLGYGDKGAGQAVPGGAALDFTVTLVEVVK